jgi:hypothetical protein
MKIKKQKINYWAPMLLETDKNNKPSIKFPQPSATRFGLVVRGLGCMLEVSGSILSSIVNPKKKSKKIPQPSMIQQTTLLHSLYYLFRCNKPSMFDRTF